MSTKLRGLLVLCGILFGGILFAQEKTVTGTVTDAYGFGVPDASVTSSSGQEVFTDMDGNYSITANEGDVLTIEALGLDVSTVTVGASNVYNASLKESGAIELEGAVVTALGITRDKKSLGYATQEVSGETISATPVSNFADALSGEVAGLDVKSSGTMGGSTNMIIRGTKSLTGNNQALVVIDGIPINNGTDNTKMGLNDQSTGRGGFDYGNAASDINPNDIETVNVLKGAAATALYGSRGANGVIMITTKKGKKSTKIGVEINSSFVVGTADRETLPKYQKEYGGGYMGTFEDTFTMGDINGDGIDDITVNSYNDASYGAAYDPNLLVYNWDSFYYPQLSNQLPSYLIATPWVAGKNDPNSIWKTSTTFVNSAAFSGGNEKGSFRFGFTNSLHDGNLDNSSLKRNTLDFSGAYNLTEKLKVSTSVIYTNNKAIGRYGTGYDGLNPMQAFRQWFNLATDMQKQKDVYFLTGENISWNANSWDDSRPAYSDNYYFTRYQNYQNDERDRYTGMAAIDYKLTDWLSAMGRFTFDNYDELREERIAEGTVGKVSEYYMNKRSVSENNYDLILSFNKDLTENINLEGNVGWNLRVNQLNSFAAATSGGLAIPGIYSLNNSSNPLTAADMNINIFTKKVDGEYARASLGLYNMVFLEGSIRTDRSSALPKDNNRYWYPSASASLVFSELIKSDWLSFGKLRANYAEVGNDTDPYNTTLRYDINAPFNGYPSSTNLATWGNPDLRPERTKGMEFGLEMAMFKNRVSFEVNYYNTKTYDLITQTAGDPASGFAFYFTNVGDIRNKGIEASLRLTPIRSNNFEWNLIANFAKNDNELESLNIEYYQLANVQGGLSIGGYVGEQLGVLRGTDYVYDESGNRIVGANGQYLLSDPDAIIGNFNPDWTGGLRNMLRYKELTLSFLIDVQQGGDVFSLDTWYGYATGLYANTVGLNDLGNPVRNTLADGGGIILPGVKEDGTPNDIRVRTDYYANPWGYARTPNSAHVYDASFVKLRNVTLSYDLPDNLIQNTFVKKFTISAIGRNLWIIHKNVPYSDPEAGLSAGNIQGYQSGAYPTIREIGASIKVEF